LTPAYQALGAPGRGTLQVTEALAPEILSLPMFSELTSQQIEHVANSIREFFSN
jgi:UDP-2-acetamido-2-deoxy-ribo-hexuluronate aminotransferase